jgi:hypothetical protein
MAWFAELATLLAGWELGERAPGDNWAAVLDANLHVCVLVSVVSSGGKLVSVGAHGDSET